MTGLTDRSRPVLPQPDPDACGVWIFAEQHEGRLLPAAAELLGQGRRLADRRGCAVTALLLGRGIADRAADLIAHGADVVLLCDDEALAEPLDEPYADLIAALAAERKPEILLLAASGFGRSIAPRIAARLRTGLTADCTGLDIDPAGLLLQTRPAYGGNLMATIVTRYGRPQMATIRPGVLPAGLPDFTRRGQIIPVTPPPPSDRVQLLAQTLCVVPAGLAGRQIIVSAGRGIGSVKNLALVRALAERLGGAYGVSRPLVDMGWSDAAHQIGQTGQTVSPTLLIACGISGAIQHLAGISGARTIIALNTDPEAPIFSVADYRVVGDCVAIVKKLLTLLED
jgi:electron transfer flavoprotein alpha subunit